MIDDIKRHEHSKKLVICTLAGLFYQCECKARLKL